VSPLVGPDGELALPVGDPPRLSCQQMIAILTDAAEGVLDDDARVDYDAHLRICIPCVTFIGQLDTTRSLVAGLGPSPDLPPEMVGRLADAFREQLSG
jgi:hypothetical protein